MQRGSTFLVYIFVMEILLVDAYSPWRSCVGSCVGSRWVFHMRPHFAEILTELRCAIRRFLDLFSF